MTFILPQDLLIAVSLDIVYITSDPVTVVLYSCTAR